MKGMVGTYVKVKESRTTGPRAIGASTEAHWTVPDTYRPTSVIVLSLFLNQAGCSIYQQGLAAE